MPDEGYQIFLVDTEGGTTFDPGIAACCADDSFAPRNPFHLKGASQLKNCAFTVSGSNASERF